MTITSRLIHSTKLNANDRTQTRSDLSSPVAQELPEWGLIIRTRSNVLLQGPQTALDEAITSLKPHLTAPFFMVSGLRWSLPDIATGTLWLEHVAHCSTEQQRGLRDWLDGAGGRVQVITTTERPLFALVECDRFLSSLYYRLNTFQLNLGDDS